MVKTCIYLIGIMFCGMWLGMRVFAYACLLAGNLFTR